MKRKPKPKKRPLRAATEAVHTTAQTPRLTVTALVEVMCAVHLSSYVDSPFVDRGGLMVVGPPSVLKSTLLGVLDKNYSDAVSLSDINARSLNDLRDQIAGKAIRTLVIPEYAKLHDRHPYTASNVEGTIRALVGEGFVAASFDDARINRLRARVTLLSAMVPKFQVDHFKNWEDTGFNRRFLWSLVRLEDPDLLDRAVEEWQLIDFKIAHIPPAPSPELIPNMTVKRERQDLRKLCKYQPGGGHSIQLALLVKVLAVLKWWYKHLGRPERQAEQTILSFAGTLGKEGAELIL